MRDKLGRYFPKFIKLRTFPYLLLALGFGIIADRTTILGPKEVPKLLDGQSTITSTANSPEFGQ